MVNVNKSCLVGITGTYCSGKNHVTKLLEARGFETLDVDKLGHTVIELEKEKIAGHFGASVLDREGRVDRKAVGERVFGRKDELEFMESIVHPGVGRLIDEWITGNSGKPKLINAALLHRVQYYDSLDFIFLVRAPFLTRLFRARKRDGLSFSRILERFKSQRQFISQYLSGKTDIQIVDNGGWCGIGAKIREKRLNHRIDGILSQKGMAG